MTTRQLFLGIDCGTQGTKAIILDAVNGQVFVVYGPMVALMAAPVVEQRFDAEGDSWSPETLSAVMGDYFADRDPAKMFSASAALRALG